MEIVKGNGGAARVRAGAGAGTGWGRGTNEGRHTIRGTWFLAREAQSPYSSEPVPGPPSRSGPLRTHCLETTSVSGKLRVVAGGGGDSGGC